MPLAGWTDKIWVRRYQAIVISAEEAAQTGRFEYLLAHGVKEGLVEHVQLFTPEEFLSWLDRKAFLLNRISS